MNMSIRELLIVAILLWKSQSASSLEDVYGNPYSPIIQNICNGSTESESCTKCLEPIINNKTIALQEIGEDKIDSLRRCLMNASEAFHNFSCQLLEAKSFTFNDFLGETCVKSLQTKYFYLDLSVDLSKTQSNPGYYRLGEVTVTALYGILKYSNNSNIQALDTETKDTENCSLIEESSFLPSFSQANGHSWSNYIQNRGSLTFKAVNLKVCEGNTTCMECLDFILNVEIIQPRETSGEHFLKLLECKSLVPKSFSDYISSIQEEYTVQKQVPQTCLDYLKRPAHKFKFNSNLNTSDLARNTFYIQEIIKFGIGTVFYYMKKEQGRVPDATIAAVCHDVLLPYIQTFLYAMASIDSYINDGSRNLKSKSPYRRLFERICNEDDKYCQACHQKVGYSVNVEYPAELSDTLVKVFKLCKGQQKEAFKKFSGSLNDKSFNTCIKYAPAYGEIFNNYPINNATNIQTTATRPNFVNYRVFLDFGFRGICYYYKGDSAEKLSEDGRDKTLSLEMHEIGLPRAYMFVMPDLNLNTVRNITECLRT